MMVITQWIGRGDKSLLIKWSSHQDLYAGVFTGAQQLFKLQSHLYMYITHNTFSYAPDVALLIVL